MTMTTFDNDHDNGLETLTLMSEDMTHDHDIHLHGLHLDLYDLFLDHDLY